MQKGSKSKAKVKKAKAANGPKRFLIIFVAGLLLASVLAVSVSGVASAATTLTVNSLVGANTASSDGICTLRDAINVAGSTAIADPQGGDCGPYDPLAGDTIQFSVAGTINLAAQLPAITQTTTIIGGGAIVIDGGGAVTNGLVVQAFASGSTITGLTIVNTVNGIVLDGADNMTVSGNTLGLVGAVCPAGQTGSGIVLQAADNATITGNTIDCYTGAGIFMQGSTGVTIQLNSIGSIIAGTGNGVGIFISTSTWVQIDNNDISFNDIHGMFVGAGSTAIDINNNTIQSNGGDGIRLTGGSSNNVISGNTISDNGEGIFISGDNNQVFNNNFIDNNVQAFVDSGSGNVFNLSAPTGGNYWNDFDTPAEGCSDNDVDGFCDASYFFTGGQDDLPWTTQSGLEAPLVITVDIDIKPGSDPNSINCKSRGVVPIGILSGGLFDATTIDISSLTINGNPTTEVHGTLHIEDVDGDSVDDAVIHVSTADVCDATTVVVGTEPIAVAGSNVNGLFEGTDNVRIVKRS